MACMYLDNFVNVGPGHIQNHPLPIAGEVADEWPEIEGAQVFVHRRMDDGQVYRRSDVYFYQSPYGWEKVAS